MENKYVSVVDSFRLLSEVKKLFVYIDTYVYINFPKDRKHLKILLFDECKSLYTNIVKASNSEGNVRKKYQMEALCNISFVDFLIGYLYDLNILIKRRYSSAIRLLSSVEAMVRMNSKGMGYLLGFFFGVFLCFKCSTFKTFD